MQFCCTSSKENTMDRHDSCHPQKDISLFGVNLSTLISRTQEKSVKMPAGLSREQRRAWANRVSNQLQGN